MNEYLVTIPDHPNSLDKRLAARPKHLANLKPHIDSGKVVFGGAMLSRHPEEGEGADMTVSYSFFCLGLLWFERSGGGGGRGVISFFFTS
jgi:hypothetical protein